MAKAVTLEPSLKKLIREKYTVVEEVPWLTRRSWIRASGFSMLCPREEVLCSIGKVKRERRISPDLNLIFQHGHALHARLQDHILPAVGVLRGKWICVGCGTMYGGHVEDGVPTEEWAVARPSEPCSCGSEKYNFNEVRFVNEEYRIAGHTDGFLSLPEYHPGLGVLEAKTIATSWQISNVPKLEHDIQAQVYMWLSGCEWGVILYWVKSENGLGGLVEHFIERDEGTIDRIKAVLRSIWEGIETENLPDRICASDDCKRAKACAVKNICFSMDSGEVDVL